MAMMQAEVSGVATPPTMMAKKTACLVETKWDTSNLTDLLFSFSFPAAFRTTAIKKLE